MVYIIILGHKHIHSTSHQTLSRDSCVMYVIRVYGMLIAEVKLG